MKKLKFKPIIGLEVHVELSTESKMFCGCSTHHFRVKPNTHTCPVCLGLPGALPAPNKKAIDWCQFIGLGLNCKLKHESKFDRKNYFYPDLPKGYQISQYDQPLCINGQLRFKIQDSRFKIVRINRVHMEEDTGKLKHATLKGKKVTLVDFNRSGIPLVEIVSEPDINSSEEAVLYLKSLQQIIRYLGVSNADMEKGSMRLEPTVNLEIIKDRKRYYTPLVEIKNINSFRFAKRAINYEIERQLKEFKKTGEVKETGNKKTRGFDEKTGKTFLQRQKEEASDYRYFPEPDIPPMKFTNENIEALRNLLPELPNEKLKRFVKQYCLSDYNATILVSEKEKADYFENTMKELQATRPTRCRRTCVEAGAASNKLQASDIANMIVNKKVNIKKQTPQQLVKNLISQTQAQITDKKQIEKIVKQVLRENKKAVADYKKGKKAALGFLIGQVMKKGRFNVGLVRQTILRMIELKRIIINR